MVAKLNGSGVECTARRNRWEEWVVGGEDRMWEQVVPGYECFWAEEGSMTGAVVFF